MSATFDVSGQSVSATLEVRTMCGSVGSGQIFGVGGSFLTGTVSSDGSFAVSTPATPAPLLGGTTVTISGSVPKAAGASWTGTYTIAGDTGTCPTSGNGAFAATPIGDVTGTYTGVGTLEMASATGLGSPPTLEVVASTVTLNLQQGGVLYGLTNSGATSRLALNGSIQVSGLPCFSKGTASMQQAGIIAGSIAQPVFLMDDGSKLNVLAEVLDQGADQVLVRSLLVTGGQCAGLYVFGPSAFVVLRQQASS